MALEQADIDRISASYALFGIPLPAGVDLADLIRFSESRRPGCLPQAQADEAQIWFIAFMVQNRADANRMLTTGGGSVTEEREGDLMRKVSTTGASSKASVTGLADKYYERWRELAALCGEIGASAEPIRRGAMTVGNRFCGPGDTAVVQAGQPGWTRFIL